MRRGTRARKGGQEKPTCGVWRHYRRKCVTERKHLPGIDVAQAGGWSDTQTLLPCNQQPNHETLLAVVKEGRATKESGPRARSLAVGAPGFEPGTSCSQSISVGVSDTTTCSIYAVLRASSSYLNWGKVALCSMFLPHFLPHLLSKRLFLRTDAAPPVEKPW